MPAALCQKDYIGKMAGFFHGEERINGLMLGQFMETWENADEDDFSLDELIDKFDGDLELATEILDVFMADTRKRLASLSCS